MNFLKFGAKMNQELLALGDYYLSMFGTCPRHSATVDWSQFICNHLKRRLTSRAYENKPLSDNPEVRALGRVYPVQTQWRIRALRSLTSVVFNFPAHPVVMLFSCRSSARFGCLQDLRAIRMNRDIGKYQEWVKTFISAVLLPLAKPT